MIAAQNTILFSKLTLTWLSIASNLISNKFIYNVVIHTGLFSNYVTLKPPFFDPSSPTITFHHEWSQNSPDVIGQAWHRYYPLLYLLLLFFEVEKKQTNKYAPTHDTSTHVSLKRIKIALESLFSMNYLTREKSMCICQVLCIRPSNRLYIVKYKGSRSVSDLWNIILNIVKVSVIDRVPFELLECHVLKLFFIFFHIGEHFHTATGPFWGTDELQIYLWQFFTIWRPHG